MAYNIATKSGIQKHFTPALFKSSKPYFDKMEEGSFFCDDIRFSPSKIHIVKVSTKNLVAIKPLLSKDKVKLGMAIVDGSYLVGKIIEVNFTNSRALLLSDLNSKIPVLLEPFDMHAVLSGTGQNFGVIEYTKDEYEYLMKGDVIVYTSGQGGLFKPGLPVGKITIEDENRRLINFFSDFKQLDYVKIVSYNIGAIN